MSNTVREANTKMFIDGYLTAALWSSHGSDDPTGGEYLDENYDEDDIVPESKANHQLQCANFIAANWDLLVSAVNTPGYSWGSAGHDFWLTRNGHGAGFWDRGLGDVGEKLSAAARLCGGCDPWVDEAGGVHLSM